MEIKACIETLLRDGFILVFNQDQLDVIKTAEALLEAGVNNMEITCRIKKPLEKISQLRQALPDFTIGAASLVDFTGMLETYNRVHFDDPLPSVDEVVDAGADYLVSAGNFSKATYKKYSSKLPIIPGCGTATEILDQFSKGANLCKIFPAKQLGGPAFVQAIDAPLHKIISLIPTGGTSLQNIPDYIAAGILVLGGSFSMIDKSILQRIISEQDYQLLADECKIIKQQIDDLRAQQWLEIDFAQSPLNEISKITGRNFNL